MSGNNPSANPLSYAGILPNFPPNQIKNNRPPNSTDINANIGDEWEDLSVTPSEFWKLANLYFGVATWVKFTGGTGLAITLTGNTGGAVSPDVSNNINVEGDGTTVTVAGNPGTNTLTISAMGSTNSYVEDSGTAAPSVGVLNVLGGTGVSTVGSGNTITINAAASVATLYTENSGTATPIANNLNVLGGTGITTTGSGSTITIDASASVPLVFTEDTGSATPSANNLNILGGTGIATSGSGSTVTITAAATVPTTFTEDVGTASPAANNLNIIGGTGIATSGSGSTVTIDAAGSVATTYQEDIGTATPAANVLKIVGGTGISTSGSGNTITITNTGGGGGGGVLQQVRTFTSAVQIIKNFMPDGSLNVAPTTSNGALVLSVNITPTTANSVLVCEATATFGFQGTTSGVFAFFLGGATTCFAAFNTVEADALVNNAFDLDTHTYTCYISPGSTSPTSISLYGGPVDASRGPLQQMGINAWDSFIPIWGGKSFTNLRVTEFSA